MPQDKLAEINSQLEQYRKEGYNIPGVTSLPSIPQYFRPYLDIIPIDASEASTDIYPTTGGRYILSYEVIKRLVTAGRIQFVNPRVSLKDGIVRTCIEGKRFNMDGTTVRSEDLKVLDIALQVKIMREFYAKAAEDNAKEKGWSDEVKMRSIEVNLKEYSLHLERFASERTISGAKRRVVTQLLGLKTSYTLEELQKPFVIVSMIPALDTSDPQVKGIVTKHLLGIEDILYPTASGINHHEFDVPMVTGDSVEVSGDLSLNITRPDEDDDFEEYPAGRQKAILSSMQSNADVEAMSSNEMADLYRSLTSK